MMKIIHAIRNKKVFYITFFTLNLLLIFWVDCLTGQTPPPQAVAAGYTKLAFYDDFTSTGTIDMEDTRTAGFNWYRARPFGYVTTPKDRIKVSDGVLTINSVSGPNYGIGSTCMKDGSIIGFSVTGGAYFEASISFDPDITGAKGWPSFWSMADEHLWTHIGKNFIECDFMEYIVVSGVKTRYIGAIHWWLDVTSDPRVKITNNGNYFINTGPIDWKNTFNTVGTLWVPGNTINYYFNNTLGTTNTYTAYPHLKGADSQHWPLILGSDEWPMKVDWVRVWVKDTVKCVSHPVTGVTLNKASTNIWVSKKEQLSASVLPIVACNLAVSWNSSNNSIATVDVNGLVTAVSVGTANISATTIDGGFTAGCAVTVRDDQVPYKNVPREIPGIIQAEDYDEGGENVAYHDTDAGNSGGKYRTDNVDIKTTTDNLGGEYDIGWTANGEWLEYTTNVIADLYNIRLRVGSASSGNQVLVKLDGDLLATVNVPNPGNWNDKTTQTLLNVSVPGGNSKILRLEIAGSGVDINWIEFIPSSTSINDTSSTSGNGLLFFPNPANPGEVLKISGYENIVVNIIDLLGIRLFSGRITGGQLEIPLSLKSGMYLLSLKKDQQIKTSKLIVK